MQVYVARAGKELGSFWMDEIREKLKSGEFKPTDHGWMEGRGDWKLLTEFPELASAIPPPAKPAEDSPATKPTPQTPVAEAATDQPAKSPGNSGRSKKGSASRSTGKQDIGSTEPPQSLAVSEPPPREASLEPSPAPPTESPAVATPAPAPTPEPPIVGIFTGPDAEKTPVSPALTGDAPPENQAEAPDAERSLPVASVAEPPPEPPAQEISPPQPEDASPVAQSSGDHFIAGAPVDTASNEETSSAPPPATVEPAAEELEPEPERIFLRARPVEPEALPEPSHPLIVPGPIPTSGMAVASVVFGILSLTILPFVGAICALIFGHLARRRIAMARGALDGSSIARTGLTLGYWGFFLSLFAIAGVLAWTISTQPTRRGALMASMSNARQIAFACEAYAVDHNGAFPGALTELTPKYLPDPKKLECPLSGPSVPIGYEYYGGKNTDPPATVLLVSKGQQRKRRVVAYVDTTVKVVGNMPELPPHYER